MDVYLSTAAGEALEQAALELTQHYQCLGISYTPAAIKAALIGWLELCLEELATEALWHCAEGDRSQALNRAAFEKLLERASRAV